MTTFLSKTLMLITFGANTVMEHGDHQGAAYAPCGPKNTQKENV